MTIGQEVLFLTLPPGENPSPEEWREIESRMVEVERARMRNETSVTIRLSSGKEIKLGIHPR